MVVCLIFRYFSDQIFDIFRVMIQHSNHALLSWHETEQ
jgi:hypothetical protein